VVRTVVDPEQLEVARELLRERGVERLAPEVELLEEVPELERVPVLLVDEDVPPRDRGLRQVPREQPVLLGKTREAVRVELDDGRVVDRLDQPGAVGGLLRGSGSAAEEEEVQAGCSHR
jgi:hypothetical protein